jgi:bifunctional non-homologous end joining protein LigD
MPMSLPPEAVPASLTGDVRLQILTPCKTPPSGDGWLHEIKHDGHRLVAILPGDGQLMLLSRNGYDRTRLFREPFRPLLDARLPPIVLDGEIAVPDDRGVTHLDALSDAVREVRSDRLAYFAFDLLHLDGHDLRRCPIEDRKMLLRDVIGAARCERIVYVDHVLGIGKELFEAVRQIGAEGIVSKRRGSLYRGGESREWLKTNALKRAYLRLPVFAHSAMASSMPSMSPRPETAFCALPTSSVRLCREGALAPARPATGWASREGRRTGLARAGC